jgi:hypothetical protein
MDLTFVERPRETAITINMKPKSTKPFEKSTFAGGEIIHLP